MARKERTVKITIYATTTDTVPELMDQLNNTPAFDHHLLEVYNLRIWDDLDVEEVF